MGRLRGSKVRGMVGWFVLVSLKFGNSAMGEILFFLLWIDVDSGDFIYLTCLAFACRQVVTPRLHEGLMELYTPLWRAALSQVGVTESVTFSGLALTWLFINHLEVGSAKCERYLIKGIQSTYMYTCRLRQ